MSSDVICEAGALRLRRGGLADVDAVAGRLRPSDLLDIRLLSDGPPAEAIAACVRATPEVFAIDADQRPVAIGGVQRSRLRPGTSVMWLIGSSGLDGAFRRGGLRVSRTWFDRLRAGHGAVYNLVPEANAADLRWLGWMGFAPVRRWPDFRGTGIDCVEMLCTAPPAQLSRNDLQSEPARGSIR